MQPVIRIIGELDEESYEAFSKALNEIEEETKTWPRKVTIELCSFGGTDYIGLAYYGRIRNSPLTIEIEAYGQVFSAATLLFAAGDHRVIDSAAWFMVHDSTDKVKGQVSGIRHHLKHMDKMETHWAQLLAKHSKASVQLWRELSLKETFIDAETLLELGLADEILNGKGSP